MVSILHLVAAAALGLLVGFGLGRVKNAAKLAAVKAEVLKLEGLVSAEVKVLLADLKKKAGL